MPRLSRALPRYRKHRASGQAIVTLGGRDHYLGPHGTAVSHAEYDRLISEYLASGRQAPASPITVGITVAEVMAAYLKRHVRTHYVKAGRLTSEQACIRTALRPLRRLYGRTFAADIGPLALKAVRQDMVGQELARSTVNQHVGRIKRMFRWAASEELIPADISTALETVTGLQRGRCKARETDPVTAVSDQVVDQTLPYLAPVVADMVRLQRLRSFLFRSGR